MNLIYYRGLNCHLACIVSIAANLGVDYQHAFCTLWSETIFTEDSQYHIYLSKRVIPNLEALGIKLEPLACESGAQSTESFHQIPQGELFLVGMDTFHIPWSLFYQHFHEPHYFFAQKEAQGGLFCFDPTYQQNNLLLRDEAIAPHAFSLSRVHHLSVIPPGFDLREEAREILQKHPHTLERWRREIRQCECSEWKNTVPLLKQITAMINNRYLFQRYLYHLPLVISHDQPCFDRDFLLKWEAVKNGLHKASIMKNNESTVKELCRLFEEVIQEEIDMAKNLMDNHHLSSQLIHCSGI